MKQKPWVCKLPHLHALWIWSSHDLFTLFLLSPLLTTAPHLRLICASLMFVTLMILSFTSTLLEKNQHSVFSHSLVYSWLHVLWKYETISALDFKNNFSTMRSLCCRQIFHLLWRTRDLVLFLRAEPYQTGEPCTGWQNTLANFQIGAD